jgi:hypothetical protein
LGILPDGTLLDKNLILPINPVTGYPFDSENQTFINPNTHLPISIENMPRDD